jgi:hypothetical protein
MEKSLAIEAGCIDIANTAIEVMDISMHASIFLQSCKSKYVLLIRDLWNYLQQLPYALFFLLCW